MPATLPVTSRGNKTRGDEPSSRGFIYAFLQKQGNDYRVDLITKLSRKQKV